MLNNLHQYLDFRLNSENPPKEYFEILQLFSDTKDASFSIHNISLMGKHLQNKEVGEWFSPANVSLSLQCVLLLHFPSTNHLLFNRKLVEASKFDSELAIYVANDCTVYKDEITRLSRNWDKSIIISIPLRLGVDCIPPSFYEIIMKILQFPQTLGIAGGKPKTSLYFFGIQGFHFICTKSPLYLFTGFLKMRIYFTWILMWFHQL